MHACHTVLATAAPAAPAPGGAAQSPGATLVGMMPVIFILIIAWILLIRPQQKRAKEHQEMVGRLKAGDRVRTSGGIYGLVTTVSENVLTVEIAKGVEVKLARGAISVLVDEDGKEKV